ncbi:hypothetical protein SESBI_40886 [Sesbania bispinosa]|nr:hypothetical protein SESBI_40886 [Sesbania bispinosa]
MWVWRNGFNVDIEECEKSGKKTFEMSQLERNMEAAITLNGWRMSYLLRMPVNSPNVYVFDLLRVGSKL